MFKDLIYKKRRLRKLLKIGKKLLELKNIIHDLEDDISKERSIDMNKFNSVGLYLSKNKSLNEVQVKRLKYLIDDFSIFLEKIKLIKEIKKELITKIENFENDICIEELDFHVQDISLYINKTRERIPKLEIIDNEKKNEFDALYFLLKKGDFEDNYKKELLIL